MSTVNTDNRPGKGYEKIELGKQRQSVENRQAPHFLAHAPPKGQERDQSAWYLHLGCVWGVVKLVLLTFIHWQDVSIHLNQRRRPSRRGSPQGSTIRHQKKNLKMRCILVLAVTFLFLLFVLTAKLAASWRRQRRQRSTVNKVYFRQMRWRKGHVLMFT